MKLYDMEDTRIEYRPMSLEDAEAIHVFASDPLVSRYIGWPLMKTHEDTRKYVEKMVERESRGDIEYANMWLKETGELIGTVMLFAFDQEAKHAEIGYVLRQDQWGKGLITDAVRTIQAYAWDILKLRRLFARVVSVNIGSSIVLEKNGFEREGCLKDYYFIEDQFQDCLWYGCDLSGITQ